MTHCFQDADGLLAEPDRVENVVMEDGLKQIVLVVGLEGGLTSHHLVHQHPQGPPVHRGAVLQLLQDLFGTRATSASTEGCPLWLHLRHKRPWEDARLYFQLAPL